VASLGHAYLGSFLMDSENIKSLTLGTLVKKEGSVDLGSDYGAQSVCFKV
jgi:hypothetical protein